MKLTKPINRAALKRRILQLAERHRPAVGFNRVSEETLILCETHLESFVVAKLLSHPSLGKTVKF